MSTGGPRIVLLMLAGSQAVKRQEFSARQSKRKQDRRSVWIIRVSIFGYIMTFLEFRAINACCS